MAALIPSSGKHPFPDAIAPLTSVRFFLALGVVLFHYQLTWTLPPEASGLLNRARLGVDVFFILSGFILTHVYLQGDAAPDFRRFIVARFARIYPAHLFILLAMLILVAGAGLVGVALEAGRFNLPHFLMTLFLVQAWFPYQDAEWNGPSWSLSAEWFAYLIFPAYAWIALRLRRRPWLIIGLAVLLFVVLDAVYRAVFGPVLPRAEGSMGILRILPEFLYGIGLYYLGQGFRVSPRASLALAAGSTGLLLFAMQYPLDDRLIVLLAGPFLLALALLAKSGARTFLSAPAWLFAGEASFALYMVHIPVLMVWRNLAEKLLGLPSDYRMGLWELALLLALSLAVAAFVHVAVERPGRRILRRLLARRHPTPRPEPGRFVQSDQGESL
ncbi:MULTISPECIES: acyltransferase [Brevundimonas]|uniref:Acyltransferase n=1 Tax=Brevundimonas pondensis TaxID=2774189 RepID=A0ABX7SM14_9CAUL|nr:MULTISPECIES: acyltransferase [Brevundimonas]NWE53919.1 acyltransferase [Brevundimonas sp. P7753]QTC88749.1 acyltransferase [Brevundimonas pondensis]